MLKRILLSATKFALNIQNLRRSCVSLKFGDTGKIRKFPVTIYTAKAPLSSSTHSTTELIESITSLSSKYDQQKLYILRALFHSRFSMRVLAVFLQLESAHKTSLSKTTH